MKKWFLAALVAAVSTASGGVAASAAATAPSAPRAGIGFGACPSDLAQSYPDLTCAKVSVPVDYADPGKGSTSVLISKRAARDPAKRRGTLLVDPGGPGAGGAAYVGKLTKPDAAGATRLPAAVLDSYDVIGLDPRGVAHSADPVSCVDPSYLAGPRPDPDAAANRAAYWTYWTGFARGCEDKSGSLLAHVGTRDVARDMDRIRADLGESKISYLGFSYGTYLGAVYGTMFPGRVDRMVLDGNVDPTPEKMWYRAALAQDAAVQKRFESWEAWAAKYDGTFHLGTTAEQVASAWNRTLADFRKSPHGAVGANELLTTVLGMMYDDSSFQPLAQAVADYTRNGDDAGLVGLATPGTTADAERSTASYTAVICRDAAWPADKSTYETDAAKEAATSQFAWSNMWSSGTPCRDWPVAHEQRVLPDGKGLPPILMFNATGDPATPYAGALRMHRALPSSVLVTEKDSGKHCVFANPLSETNADAQRIGADYLVDGKLPGGDTTIPGHALPVPSQATARKAVGVPVVPEPS